MATAMLAGTPVILLREGTERAQGKDAQKESIRAARALAESVRSTLGPRGRDKMLVGSVGDIVITNDGATLLKEMEVTHAAAKMLVEVARTQDQECGDGTKSAVVLAGELLKKAEELLDEKVHPTLITRGYHLAAERALAALEAIARPVRRTDRELLATIADTSMISKGVAAYRGPLAKLAVDAVEEVVEEVGGRLRFDRKNIQIVRRPGGDIADSEVIHGHIVEQQVVHPEMPRWVDPARIALVEGGVEPQKSEFASEIHITEPRQMQAFQDEEARNLDALVERLVRSGANVLFAGKGIDDVAAEHLARAHVFAVRRVKRSDLDLLARATGARLVARPQDLEAADLGRADLVEDRKVGEDHLTIVRGAPNARAVTLFVRGGSEHVVAEVERSLVDAISTVGLALEDGRVVTGAGAAAIELGLRVRELAPTVGGREQLAIEAFASALEVIPIVLAENAGMDPVDTLIELRRRHALGELSAGVDVLGGRVSDMSEIAVEPLRVDRQIVEGATEAATMLLRIDDVILAKRASGGPPPPSGPSGGAGAFE